MADSHFAAVDVLLKKHETLQAELTRLRAENEKLREMRLFVWSDFYRDYTNGMAVVIAPNLYDAQKLLINHGWTFTDGWGDVKEFPLSEPHVFAVAGGG